MSRFAKVEEPAIHRQAELTGEEMRLYVLIKFHTWNESGICRKNLRQIAKIHGISYTHTTERYKKLKRLGWCEDTKNGIRPTVALKVPETGTSESEMFPKPEHAYSENRNIDVPETGTSESEMFPKPEHPSIPYKESFKDQSFSDTTHIDGARSGVRVENDKNLSKFSLAECHSYALLCLANGDDIRNPTALAVSLHKSGVADAFIEARLYPPRQQQSEPSFTPDGEFVPQPLTDTQRKYYLENLASFSEEEFDESEWQTFFTPGDWAWLQGELNNAE